MKYKASLDTPGSKIPRRFAADLEVKQHKDHQQLSVQLTSPFKIIGGSGSFELHTNSKEIFSVNLTSKITPSISRDIYETTGMFYYLDQEPTRVNSSITVIKGRKHHLSFVFKTNKPLSKPVVVKGTIMKEGHLDLLHKAEGKLSTEVSIESPLGDSMLRSTIETRSKKLQSISVNFGIDYQKPGDKKYSVKLAGTLQNGRGKMNANSRFEITQFPEVNWYLNWEIQRGPRGSLKNDMILKYGRNPENSFIHLVQQSRMPELSNGENIIHLKIPRFNVNYHLFIKHDLKLTSTPKLYAEVDLGYKDDKHLKGIVDVKCESKNPLKASVKLEVEHPGEHYIYENEIVETSYNIIEGKSKFQYKHGKIILLKYKYKKLSDDSKFHHEIESSLQTPATSSPIKSKVSLQVSNTFLTAVGQVGSKYYLQAYLSQEGVSHINLKSPMIEGKIKLTNEVPKKNINLDLNLKTSNPRHVTASLLAEKLGEKKTFLLEIIPDVDRQNENKILVSSVMEVSKKSTGDTYCRISKLHIFDLIDISLAESGDDSFLGNQEYDLAYIARGWVPTKVTFRREISDANSTTFMIISRKEIDVAEIQIDTNLTERHNKKQLSFKGSIMSPSHSFDNVDLYLIQEIISSDSSVLTKSHLFFKKKENVFKVESSFDLHPNSVELKSKLHTPFVSYEKLDLGMHFQRSDQEIQSSMKIEIPNNKMIFMRSEIKKKNRGFSATWKLNSSFENFENVQAQFIVYNHQHKKSLEVYFDVDDSRMCQVGCVEPSSNGNRRGERFKISDPLSIKIQRLHLKLQRTIRSLSIEGKMGLTNGKNLSINSETKVENHRLSTMTVITTPYEKLKDSKIALSVEDQPYKRNILGYFDLNGQRKGYIELLGNTSLNSFGVQGHFKAIRIPEILVQSEFEKHGESFSFFANVLKNTIPFLATNLERLSNGNGEKLLFKAKKFENTILDLEISKDVSDEYSYKYVLKTSGSFTPISITFSTNRIDDSSITKAFIICQEVSPTKCYFLKSYHKKLINSNNYRYYQKLIVDFAKSVGGTPVETLGYELKLHKRQHENDKLILDAHTYLPQCSSNLKISILHNIHHLNVELEAIPNTIDSTHKLSFEMKKEVNSQSKELVGYIKMNHPEMTQPLLLTYKFKEVEHMAFQGKLVLGSMWGNTLTVEMLPNLELKSHGSESIVYKLYTENKSLDISLKLIKQSSRDEHKVGYEWKYNSGSSQKKGGIMVIHSNKKAERSRSIKILFLTTTSKYEIQGIIVPNDASIRLVSNGQIIREIHLKVSDSCLDIEIVRADSSPIMKSTLCINHREDDTLQLMKADLFYRQDKCLDVCVAAVPEKPTFIDVALKWKMAGICRALIEVTGWKDIQHSHYLSHFVKEFTENFDYIRRNVLKSFSEKLKKKMKIIEEEISWKIKSVFRRHSEFLSESMEAVKNAQSATVSFINSLISWEYFKNGVVRFLNEIQGYALRALEHIQGLILKMTQTLWSQIDHYRKKLCNPDTFCYRLVQIYQGFSVQRIKALIYGKIAEISKDLKVRITTITFHDIIKWIHNSIQRIKKIIESVFGKFGDMIISKIGEFGMKLEKILRQKVIDAIDKVIDYINKIFGDDEDYKTAKSLITGAKKTLMNAWKNKEEIAENTLRPIKNKLTENVNKLLEKKFQVLKFDLKDGVINFRFHQPLGPIEIQILENEMQTIKRNLEELLTR
ncbi:hypothetical protein HNY73_010384 [Argiope bruennichi]|uniref:Uncharacterized protein n=1 Tax=Argiope bruennichi TaxID=94029 RepID=A0A8T0F1N0_ARGBR|nr:hypothetical protein HNY73_010384 [Argiope bruennichi]